MAREYAKRRSTWGGNLAHSYKSCHYGRTTPFARGHGRGGAGSQDWGLGGRDPNISLREKEKGKGGKQGGHAKRRSCRSKPEGEGKKVEGRGGRTLGEDG